MLSIDPSFPDADILLSEEGWLDASQLRPEWPITALLYPGLMTHAVRNYLDMAPRIQKMPSASGAFRQICFFANEELFLIALSHIPTQLAAIHSWLIALGDQPLGEAIEMHAGVQRNDFEILPLKSDSALDANFGGEPTWARRYHFELPGGQVAVMEIFNPRLLKQLNQQLQNG